VSAWWRLGGRLADLARLCLPDDAREAHGRHVLQHGSLPGPGEGSALSWIEMARGTLLHWVWLDGADQQSTVRTCQVIAPTEWNFHRDGPVARLLSTLSPGPWTQRDAALAVAAWDPCVPFVIDPADTSTDRPTENAHA
jgi:Ni,Fe-hydrogenase III large subunit